MKIKLSISRFALVAFPLLIVALAAVIVFTTNIASSGSVQCTDTQVDLFRQLWEPCLHYSVGNSSSNMSSSSGSGSRSSLRSGSDSGSGSASMLWNANASAGICQNATCSSPEFAQKIPDCYIATAWSLRAAVESIGTSCRERNAPTSATCSDEELDLLHNYDSRGRCSCSSTSSTTGVNAGCVRNNATTSIRARDVNGYCSTPTCSLYLVHTTNSIPRCARPEVSAALGMCVNAVGEVATPVFIANGDAVVGDATAAGSAGANTVTWTDSQRQAVSLSGSAPYIGVGAVILLLTFLVSKRYESELTAQNRRSVASTVSTSAESLLEDPLGSPA